MLRQCLVLFVFLFGVCLLKLRTEDCSAQVVSKWAF